MVHYIISTLRIGRYSELELGGMTDSGAGHIQLAMTEYWRSEPDSDHLEGLALRFVYRC